MIFHGIDLNQLRLHFVSYSILNNAFKVISFTDNFYVSIAGRECLYSQ